ncbi:dedicator of cytokinesis protein 9-like isoform X7 [Ostrea edulis]|uniref:dedicator of cytokinesis protein 9-like isoform X7 n=1 Tax=Ostrea edulis TaxID=37623 RepID=UPI0024AF4B98|nr:dedicator of cytokinesis protein 9-like isoform X7 [Ostrea edulis]
MTERKFRQVLHRQGEAAKIRQSVALQMRENIILRTLSIEINNNYAYTRADRDSVVARPKQVDPVDYETYIAKNKSILHNDPQREMLTFPYDDIIIPPPNPPKKMRTLYSTVPNAASDEAKDLLVRQCIKSYTDSCHVVQFKYNAYAGRYEKLPNLLKSAEPLPQHTFEIDAEPEDKGDEDTRSLTASIQKTGWLYKGPDGGKENIISFTRQFKKRYFVLKQESDFTFSLQFYKDEKKTDAKGAIFMDLAVEARPNSKRGKHCFEVHTNDRPPYVFAAESDAEMTDWIKVLNKVINAAETASNISIERSKEENQTPDKSDGKPEVSMHPELAKYNRESEMMLTKAREEGRHNLFRVYPNIKFHFDDEEEEEEGGENSEEIEVFPATHCNRYMMRLVDFKLKTQVNFAEEGLGQKSANPEPFFLSFALYDAKEGKKISEDFYIDPNDREIKQMIPDEVLLASDKLHTVEGRNSAPDLHQLSEEWLLKKDRHAVFSVTSCHAEVYLFVRIEKVLQGSLSQACDQYLKAPSGSKIYRQMKQFCSQIGHHRMPFGWAARQLIIEANGPADMKIYKQEGSKFSELEVIKILQDFKRPEKHGKLQEIPGYLKVIIHKINPELPLQNTLTSSLVPIKPFPIPPPDPPAIEVEQFVLDKASFCDTFDSYVNHLYVYPMNLRYEHQKSFAKARNIACCVEIRDSDDENAIPLKRIYARPEVGVFTTVACATVLHHNTSPDFLEEVKIALPIQLHDKHHILFRFYHVSCEGSKSNRSSTSSIKKRDNIETPVGFAWLPLLSQGRVTVGEQSIQVAACTALPKDYLSTKSPDRSVPVPDIKWVDNGKAIFKVKVHLHSTVYTKDQHLHNFFYHCQKIENALMSGADVDSLNKLKLDKPTMDLEKTFLSNSTKSLHAVDVLTYVQFLPTLLNQLFSLLVKTISDDVALNAVKVLIHIVSEVSLADKQDALKSYVKYVFSPDPIPKGSKNINTVHEELAKNLTTILRPANADNVVVCKFLKYSWFFFEVLIKSMALYLTDTDRIKMPRNERFTADYQFRIQNLLQTLTPNIIQKQREMPRETKMANQSLAMFVKSCFTLMDRGFVFKNIAAYVEQFGPGDSKSLYELKFEFLSEVCSHEHYIPLCLPIMRKGMIKSFKEIKLEDLKCDYTLSEEFRKNHYLVGLLLQEVKMCMNEPKEVRRHAIHLLRNQIAKHSFDDRYTSKTLQGRIAALYLPLISILMDHKHHLVDDPNAPPPQQAPTIVVNGDVQSGKQESRPRTPQMPQKSVTFDTPATQRESKVFALIAGHGAPMQSLSDMKAQMMNGSAGSLSRTNSTSSVDRAEGKPTEKVHRRTPSSQNIKDSASDISATPKPTQILMKYQKLDIMEVKDLLLSFLHIIKYLPEDILLGWFHNSSEFDIIDFFSILEVCLRNFQYQGKKKIVDLSVIGDSTKASTMPMSRRSVPSMTPRALSQYDGMGEPGHMSTPSEANAVMKALQEANMSTEVGLVVLDILALYTHTFKRNLEHKDGDNSLMRKVFSLYLGFLQTSQSESLQKHVFASWRSFIKKFQPVLFKGNASLCGDLCYEVLRCCNSKLQSTRKEACALLYLLMRNNFEFTKKKNFTRVHLQVIISVSQLIGGVVELSNSRFTDSLAMINSYAASDKAMQTRVILKDSAYNGLCAERRKSGFPSEVKDLTKRIRTVLMATAQMKEHENDPEMLIDLQYSLAKSYATTPELRKTWLESMANIHHKYENYSEKAHCYIHIAALVAEYLKKRVYFEKQGCFPQGCTAFAGISPNVDGDESGIKDDSGMQDVQYTEDTMVEYLEKACRSMELAERYEVLGDIYKLIIPIYEYSRDFDKLASSFDSLSKAYTKVVDVTASGKRLLGKFFRIAFFGSSYFVEEDGKEYIYKEPKVTSLPEICERLKALYSEKYGRDTVKLIMDSKKVNPAELDQKFAYIQVTHVTPYFEEKELQKRITEFERNNNIKRFMFETPFTKNDKARGEIQEQYKRRTILLTSHSFPYMKKRIEIVKKTDTVLQPIEVAIDEMQNKVVDIREVVNLSRPDLKKLQLKLQGSVSTQVNAGPMAYAQAFLTKDKIMKFPLDKTDTLKAIFKDFVYVCSDALELNGTLITTEQKEYHESLSAGYQEIVEKLSEMFGEKISRISKGSMSVSQIFPGEQGFTPRGSTVFNIVSATSDFSSA